MSEPVAWLFRGHFYDTDPSDWTVHEHPNVPVIPLYTKPQKYCPSENNEAYEKGFIDGMAKQRDSAVQRFVEGGTPDSELAEHKRIIREQQAEIEALKLAIVEYADCVDSMEGTDFISHLKYMGTSEESIALLYKLNGYDKNGYWIHKEKASEK